MSGEIVICPDCGQSWELELMSGKNDFILKKAEAQAEDWGQ
jgi:lysine biosynthesis protein LysW